MRVVAAASLCIAAIMSPAGANNSATDVQLRAVPSMTQIATMKVQLELEGAVLSVVLEDSAAARDFASMLPLTLTLEDAATEKIAHLPRKLSTKDAPPGIDPEVGDIAYYAPWGNLAIFYKDFGYSAGLVKLGRLDSGVATLQRRGPLRVTLRRAGE